MCILPSPESSATDRNARHISKATPLNKHPQ